MFYALDPEFKVPHTLRVIIRSIRQYRKVLLLVGVLYHGSDYDF